MALISKNFFKKNKLVIRFLVVFFGSYLLFAGLYQVYLNQASSTKFYPEWITHNVAVQSYHFVDFLGYEAYMVPSEVKPSMRLAINGDFVVQVVEGCNAVSVIILFFSFILAFKSSWKKTLLYILAGSTIIYVLNVMRISLLAIGIYHYPDYTELMHGTLFPLFIYGVVFLLWIIWVNQFQKKKSE
ncbi:MAG: exosortase family protein XrtF [Bacteroidota bacterium]